MWSQTEITLEPRPRGLHLITREVADALADLGAVETGLLHVFLQHTSAGLTLTENASPEVRTDLDGWLDAIAPEASDWEHSLEGPDDMPAHAKSSLLGTSLTLPVRGGELALGTGERRRDVVRQSGQQLE